MKPVPAGVRVRPVAEADRHRLAGERRQVGGQVDPGPTGRAGDPVPEVLTVRVGVRRPVRCDRRAVDRQVRVVPVGLDRVLHLRRQLDRATGSVTDRSSCCRDRRPRRSSRSSPRRRAPRSTVVTCLFGSSTNRPCACFVFDVGRAELVLGLRARDRDLVVEPAELELLPGTHVDRLRADVHGAVVAVRAARHQRPEARRVLAPGRVVQIRDAEIMGVLVREHADAAVLRLDGVVADPVVRTADLQTAELRCRQARRSRSGRSRRTSGGSRSRLGRGHHRRPPRPCRHARTGSGRCSRRPR